MKRVIITAIAALACAGALAQGQFQASTLPTKTGGVRQNIVDQFGNPASSVAGGVQYVWAQFWAGPVGGSLAPVGSVVVVGPTTAKVGLIDSPAAITVPTVPAGGDASVKVEAWATALNDSTGPRLATGMSETFTVAKLGGGTVTPVAVGAGYKGFAMIPEPSTIALGFLGAASLLFFRRK